MGVDLAAAAAVEEDAGVSHDGAVLVVAVLHGRHSRKQPVQALRHVYRALPVEDVVDDVPRLQRALQDGYVPLGVQEFQDVLPEGGFTKIATVKTRTRENYDVRTGRSGHRGLFFCQPRAHSAVKSALEKNSWQQAECASEKNANDLPDKKAPS